MESPLNNDMPPAFPDIPPFTDDRIPRIYRWIEKHFWPKLTTSQKTEMLEFFPRIKFDGSTEVMSSHWLAKEARKPNSSPMLKVLVHAIWGSNMKKVLWWHNYHQMFGHLGFPDGPAPGVTLNYKRHRLQRTKSHQEAQTNSPVAKSEHDVETQGNANVSQPALQPTPEIAMEACLVEEIAQRVINELRQPIDKLVGKMSAIQQQLALVTDRMGVVEMEITTRVDVVLQEQIDCANKMDAMQERLADIASETLALSDTFALWKWIQTQP
ncbi:hypothetical protein TARUN_5439 [Trichoderma arundinaceum]|uniref:Uncharacterized protein n=1 Tax=Trichoderma arundinaceum TaxID=490622 RepID=A0A395NL62_TRIAR|nr:hypothetical protein TARUN_5439 [Trichoderma arundinaceum]